MISRCAHPILIDMDAMHSHKTRRFFKQYSLELSTRMRGRSKKRSTNLEAIRSISIQSSKLSKALFTDSGGLTPRIAVTRPNQGIILPRLPVIEEMSWTTCAGLDLILEYRSERKWFSTYMALCPYRSIHAPIKFTPLSARPVCYGQVSSSESYPQNIPSRTN
jgi:hypothetical protein